jgi:hypothetical protein
MFTNVVNKKRKCILLYTGHLKSWEYVKYLLIECGFEVVQEASSREYVMRGCNHKVLVYVKYPEENQSIIVFMNDKEDSDQINIKWPKSTKGYHLHGEDILTKIREIWFL